MQWYYLSDSSERIPLSEAQFVTLAARGVLRPATLVWRKGLPGWTSCGEIKPEVFTAAVSRGGAEEQPAFAGEVFAQGTVTGLSRVLAGYSPWMFITGVVLALLSASLFTLLGWQLFILIREDAASLLAAMKYIHLLKSEPRVLWLLLPLEGVTAILLLWAVICLFYGAVRCRKAVASGSEYILTSALRHTGRFFLIAAVAAVLVIAVTLATGLWAGYDRVFSPPRAEKGVSI